ncbi:efflux RND transporter periplasmic adaptor subunit [Flocculibacter collagenilyticus]|uniref:efflux RND transporter periplasmic adaptor subunit n=1 Tax=Flocculibacter collagenilyticus TaxID=2744479 RepID=UPI0018F48999|nr:efflux RND transporter periplasmic adaptor subunit [Flocculibacter collagenilyticus]
MSPKAKKIVLPILVLVGCVAVALLFVGSKQPPEKKEQKKTELLVETVTVEPQDVQFVVKSQGTVKPKIVTDLVSQVNGKVVEVSSKFVEGGFFKKGDILVSIEPADYITNVKSAEANLARAKASLEEEKARAKVAQKEWINFMEGNAPDLYLRKPQLARELANVRSAEAELERAERDLKRTKIRAPFDGMVKGKTADLGRFVSTGTNLATLYGTEVAEIRLSIPDNDLAYLTLPTFNDGSMPVNVTLSALVAGKIKTWQAKLVRSEGVIDEKSRVVYAVAQINDPYGRNKQSGNQKSELQFGRFVSAEIEGNTAENIVMIPRIALKQDSTVLIATPDNMVSIKSVDVVKTNVTHAYITSGIPAGSQVITTSIPNPMEGMLVKLKSERIENDEEESTALANRGQ